MIHIVPRFAPQIDGVGDYARKFADHLDDLTGSKSRFLVGDPGWSGTSEAQALQRKAGEVSNCLPDDSTVILHYVGYGYHRRGIPVWLVNGLARWRSRKPGNRLVVVFHEIWSSGPPWKSEFYLGGLQKHLVRRLLIMADAAITSTPLMRESLNFMCRDKILEIPVPSNLTEPTESRSQWGCNGGVRVMLFGRLPTRLAALACHESWIRDWSTQGLLKELVLMGETGGHPASESPDFLRLKTLLPSDHIRSVGAVDAESGQKWFSRSDLFLSHYPLHLVQKSGALMAAMASGCVPVLKNPSRGDASGWLDRILLSDAFGEHPPGLNVITKMGEKCQQWYRANASWYVVAGKVATLLEQVEAQRIT